MKRVQIKKSKRPTRRITRTTIVALTAVLLTTQSPIEPSLAVPGDQAEANVRNGKILIRLDEEGGLLGTINKDGTGLRRFEEKGNDARWSPDGTKILFWRFGPALLSQLFTMNADGSGVRQLTHAADSWAGAWSPSGRKIVFASGGGVTRPNLWVMNADGSGQEPLTISADEGHSQPAWSPDGNTIVFVQRRNLYAVDTDGSNIRPITDLPRDWNPTYTDWSPNGRWIAFGNASGNASTHEIFKIRPDGTGLQQLTNTPDFEYYPIWAPSGKWLLFTSDGPEAGSVEIFKMRPNGTRVRQLTFSGTVKEAQDWQPRP